MTRPAAGAIALLAWAAVSCRAGAPAPAAPRADDRETRNWITRLGSDEWPEREEAQAALLRIGRPALPVLEDALAGKLDSEMRSRLEDLVCGIRRWDFPDRAAWLAAYQERVLRAHPHVQKMIEDGRLERGGSFHELLEALKRRLRETELLERTYAFQPLWDAALPLSPKELPESIRDPRADGDLPLAMDRSKSLEALRAAVAKGDAQGGWMVPAFTYLAGEEGVPTLEGLLEDKNVYARCTAAKALLMLGKGEAAVPALEAVASRYELYYSVLAMELLVAAGRREYVGTLVEFLNQLEGIDAQNDRELARTKAHVLEALERATGEARPDGKEWRELWTRYRERFAGKRATDPPPAPLYPKRAPHRRIPPRGAPAPQAP